MGGSCIGVDGLGLQGCHGRRLRGCCHDLVVWLPGEWRWMACLHVLAGPDLIGSPGPCLCQASWSWPLCWHLHTRFGGWDYALERPMRLAEAKGRDALWEAAGLGTMVSLLHITVAWPACEASSAASSCGWWVGGRLPEWSFPILGVGGGSPSGLAHGILRLD